MLPGPLSSKSVIDHIGTPEQISYLIYEVFIFLAVSLISDLASAFSNRMGRDIRLKVHYNLLNMTVERLHVLPSDFHKKEGVGSIMMKPGLYGMALRWTEKEEVICQVVKKIKERQ